MTNDLSISFKIEENFGLCRDQEPASFGVPFPKGQLKDLSNLSVSFDETVVAHGARVLNTWSDGSVKWALFDMQATVAAFASASGKISCRQAIPADRHQHAVAVEEKKDAFHVSTGTFNISIDRNIFKPFRRVQIDGKQILDEIGSQTSVENNSGKILTPVVEKSYVESCNDLKAILFLEGSFGDEGVSKGLRFRARLFFYAGHATVRCDLTLHNPNAAQHVAGLWDLGDVGSIFFKDLSIHLKLPKKEPTEICWQAEPDEITRQVANSRVAIYQDSSGGRNWRYRTHVNANGEIPLTYRGYRIDHDGIQVAEGLRATPIMSVSGPNRSVAGTIKEFWQNFPSGIEAYDNCLTLSPFPMAFSDLFELQGGEQKTHTFYVQFSGRQIDAKELGWVHSPLIPIISSDWYAETEALPYFVPQKDIPDCFPYKEALEIKDCCVDGENTLFHRREIIDEYGWRNFGDQYADHENLLFQGEKPIVSHYNNQYDLVYSFLFQFAATGRGDWFVLADQLARHVIDIDIYHTDNDKYTYNHGLFWHTDHFCDAHTSTHRSYSATTMKGKKLSAYGGGPSYEHIYLQGLSTYYFMTGEENIKEAALELAQFAANGVDGPDKPWQVIKEFVKTNLKSLKKFFQNDSISPFDLLEGPGRGSGNTFAALLDAYLLTRDKDYLDRAEYIIMCCVHPEDDLEKLKLDDVNNRWAYTLFFQSVGRYLEVKAEADEMDGMYKFAKASLIHYALWALQNEAPFLDRPEKIDFPNYATRAATDIRKNNLLLIAAKYAEEPLKNHLIKKAQFFLENSMKELIELEDSTWTRPIAILLQNTNLPIYCACNNNEKLIEYKLSKDTSFSIPKSPIKFVFKENYRLVKRLISLIV